MAWLRKNADPISERAHALNNQIASLESEIKRLDTQLQRSQAHPRLRSTAVPHGASFMHAPETTAPAPHPAPDTRQPIFEPVDQERLKTRTEAASAPELYNELGVRKYDLPALVGRIRNFFRGPTTMNPRLVSYLAAGGVQGLRPMRYEKRVARNRFIVFSIVLFLVLLGLLYAFVHRR